MNAGVLAHAGDLFQEYFPVLFLGAAACVVMTVLKEGRRKSNSTPRSWMRSAAMGDACCAHGAAPSPEDGAEEPTGFWQVREVRAAAAAGVLLAGGIAADLGNAEARGSTLPGGAGGRRLDLRTGNAAGVGARPHRRGDAHDDRGGGSGCARRVWRGGVTGVLVLHFQRRWRATPWPGPAGDSGPC